MGLREKLISCNTHPAPSASPPDPPTGELPLSEEQFHTIARALSDPRRFSMLQQIAALNDLPCSRLDAHQSISPATISHHLRELQEAGLVDGVREGRSMLLSLRRAVWQRYLDRLQQI